MNKTLVTVKNPLTVIGMFAGLAEIAGTAVLPFIAEANQNIYIWFLMLFPVFLVMLFFATLNFNPKVLYAPSDFADEKNYMDLFRPSSTSEKVQKIDDEIREQERDSSATPAGADTAEQGDISSKERLLSLMNQDFRSRYMLAENLVIDRLATEFQTAPKRDVMFRHGARGQIFDAVFEDKKGMVLVETKFFSERTNPRRVRETLTKLQDTYFALPEEARKSSRLLLAIAYEMPKEKAAHIERVLMNMLSSFSMPIQVRMYDINELIEHV